MKHIVPYCDEITVLRLRITCNILYRKLFDSCYGKLWKKNEKVQALEKYKINYQIKCLERQLTNKPLQYLYAPEPWTHEELACASSDFKHDYSSLKLFSSIKNGDIIRMTHASVKCNLKPISGTIISLACEHDNLAVIRFLSYKIKFLPEHLGMICAYYANPKSLPGKRIVEIVDVLLAQTDRLAYYSCYAETPLHTFMRRLCCNCNRTPKINEFFCAVVQPLLENVFIKYQDVNQVNNEGLTPLDLLLANAEANRYQAEDVYRIVQFFIKHGTLLSRQTITHADGYAHWYGQDAYLVNGPALQKYFNQFHNINVQQDDSQEEISKNDVQERVDGLIFIIRTTIVVAVDAFFLLATLYIFYIMMTEPILPME